MPHFDSKYLTWSSDFFCSHTDFSLDVELFVDNDGRLLWDPNGLDLESLPRTHTAQVHLMTVRDYSCSVSRQKEILTFQ